MNKIPVLTYYNIHPNATAFSTTRHGGVSKGNYGEFNINLYCGDNAEHIVANKESLAETLGVKSERIIQAHQIHGTEIRQIAEDFLTLPANIQQMALEGVDALMTDIVGVCVGVSTADCIPILMYDNAHHAVCAVHAGWRGTVAGIVKRTVAAMVVHYHSEPDKLRAVIGPGISLDAFEVGDEVYGQFASAGYDMERICRRQEKWHIDLLECNRLQLIETGIKEDNICMSGVCTYTNVDDYFSARRLGIASGRIYTGIFLNKDKT